MYQQQILVVDDDRAVLEMVKADLCRERFAVRTATSVPEAMERLCHAHPPDAMILDISLEPGRSAPGFPQRGESEAIPDDGLGLLRWLRRQADTPVIILSGTDAESVKVLAFELGADDYVTKPFGARELAARLRAVLRRAGPAGHAALHFGPLEIDPSRHAVLMDGEPVELTHAELGILHSLARARGRVLTRAQLLDMVIGHQRWEAERSVDVHIRRLRKKLESDPGAPAIILTVRGVGYRFGLSQT